MTRGPVLPTGRADIVGGLEYLRSVDGAGVAPRDVVVWLPPGYHDDPERRYPVLYLHDGHNVFDAATSHIGEDWQLDEVAAELIAQGRIEPFVAAAVYSGEDRYSLLPTGAYSAYLVDVLKPLVDGRYRTLPGREHTAAMGSSLGGLASFLAVWRRPDVFSAAACLSPYFPAVVVDEVAAGPGLDRSARVYLDNGDDEMDASFQPEIDRMLAELRRAGFVDGVDLSWYRDHGGVHDETAWSARVWRPLEFIYGPSTSSSA